MIVQTRIYVSEAGAAAKSWPSAVQLLGYAVLNLLTTLNECQRHSSAVFCGRGPFGRARRCGQVTAKRSAVSRLRLAEFAHNLERVRGKPIGGGRERVWAGRGTNI